MANIQNSIEYNGEIIEYELIKTKIKNMYIYIKDGKVIVKVPTRLKEEQIKEFVNKKANWIYKNVKKEREKTKIEKKIEQEDLLVLQWVVKNSIEKYSKLLKVTPNKVKIKDIKYAWGSCSVKKNITINQKLATKDANVIEYVVLHEMCHLKHMNHSKKFWSLVEKYMPDYKNYKKMLKS